MEEYSKIILFIHFYSIQFPPPKRGLKFDYLSRRNIVKLLKLPHNKLQNLLRFVKMSLLEPELQHPPPQPFDPTKPSLPI